VETKGELCTFNCILFNNWLGPLVTPQKKKNGHVGDYYSVISDLNVSYIAQMMAINFNENSLHFDLHRHYIHTYMCLVTRRKVKSVNNWRRSPGDRIGAYITVMQVGIK